MLKVAEVLSMAASILVDEGFENRTPTHLLKYARSGLAMLALNVASQLVKTARFPLASGPRQLLPADGEALLRLTSVFDAEGTIASYPRATDVNDLSVAQYRWVTNTAGVPRQFAVDPVDPAVFWVHPPSLAGLVVEAQYKQAVDPLDTDSEFDSVDSYYTGPLAHYVAACALMEDAEYAAPGSVADQHMKMFTAVLGAPKADG